MEKNNTDIPIKRMTSLVVASLRNDSKFKTGLADKLMNKQTVEEMMTDGGLELVERFLDNKLDEKELHKTFL